MSPGTSVAVMDPSATDERTVLPGGISRAAM
jgi:hypothetical protein